MNKTNDTILEHNMKYVSDSKGLQDKSHKTNTSGIAELIDIRIFTALSNYDLETEIYYTEPLQYLAVTLPPNR